MRSSLKVHLRSRPTRPPPRGVSAGGRELEGIPRKSDGRRIFTDEFKCKHISRVWRGEVSVAELSRELGIARSLLQRWKRLIPPGEGVAHGAGRRATPASDQRTDRYILEMQLLVGKQTVELELLRAELETLKEGKRPVRR